MPNQNYLEALSMHIEKSHAYLKTNNQDGMLASRKVLEIILNAIYDIDKITDPYSEGGHPTTYMKINKLSKIRNGKKELIYEEFIMYEMHIVRVFGNIVGHDSDVTLSEFDQRAAFYYLLKITIWFCERYDLTRYPVYTKSKEYLKDFEEVDEQSLASDNEHYLSDLKSLGKNNDYISSLLSNGTVLIVTGTHILTELYDRPLAETLKKKIHKTSSLRAIIISDKYYASEEAMHSLPVISIGGGEINSLTLEIMNFGTTRNPIRGVFDADRRINNTTQIALWGDSASETKRSVEKFINNDDGLKQLLSRLS